MNWVHANNIKLKGITCEYFPSKNLSTVMENIHFYVTHQIWVQMTLKTICWYITSLKTFRKWSKSFFSLNFIDIRLFSFLQLVNTLNWNYSYIKTLHLFAESLHKIEGKLRYYKLNLEEKSKIFMGIFTFLSFCFKKLEINPTLSNAKIYIRQVFP